MHTRKDFFATTQEVVLLVPRRNDNLSERMLVAQLRELEQHGMFNRIIYPEVPPRVEYELTEIGLSAGPLLKKYF